MLKLLLLFFTISLFANVYHIEDISESLNIDKRTVEKLKKNNIKTTNDFLFINKSSKDRALNSKKYNIHIKNLINIVFIFDLLRIKGVGPTAAKLLVKADVKSIRMFQNIDTEKLSEKLIKINKKFKISPFTPNRKNLNTWQIFSKKLKIIIL